MKRTIPVKDTDINEINVRSWDDNPEVGLFLGPIRGMSNTQVALLTPGEAVLIAEALLRGARKAAGK